MKFLKFSKQVYDEEFFTFNTEEHTFAVSDRINKTAQWLLLFEHVNSLNTNQARVIESLGDDYGKKALYFVSDEDKEFNAKT